MGIAVEFNPDLALRDRAEFEAGRRQEAECLPVELKAGETYPFLKKEQRNYWLLGELPLLRTKGDAQLSRPLASIVITEATHFVVDGVVWTRGQFKVVEVFSDDAIHFESYARVGERDK